MNTQASGEAGRYAGWFRGKTALVTGATSGIGREMALLLSRCGCAVIPCGQDRGRMESLTGEVQREGGTCPVHFVGDLSREAEIEVLVARVRSAGAAVDVLIHSAGFNWFGELEAMPAETARTMTGLHVTALTRLCAAFLPDMIRKKGGGILNVGSVASFFPTPGASLYGATKHFQAAFIDALHREVQDVPVHVSGLYPGNTRTRFLERATGGRRGQWAGGMEARAVAEQGLDGLSRNRRRIVPGLSEKIRVFVAIHGPVGWILRRAHRHARTYVEGEVGQHGQ